MIVSIIIVTLSLLLDGILSNFIPFMVGDLSIFTPLFTLVSIFLIYPFFSKRDRYKYFITLGIIGFIYDLLMTNLLFFNSIIFLIIGLVIILLYKYFDNNYLMIIFEVIILVIIYESLVALSFMVTNTVIISFNDYFYRLGHCFIANIIYAEVVLFIINKLPKRYRYTSIN